MSLSEDLASWFLRLNGFFLIENFIVHPDTRGGQRTDVDVYGVRFPHRAELEEAGRPMKDHRLIGDNAGTRPQLVLAEVKQNQPCSLNATWTNPTDLNLDRILRASGLVPPAQIAGVARSVRTDGEHLTAAAWIRLCAIGTARSNSLAPKVLQLEWKEILAFIHHRFTDYERVKRNNQQWPELARNLFKSATHDFLVEDDFVAHWLRQLRPS